MSEVKNHFRIADESDDYLWLCLDQDGQGGLEVPVPKESPKYDAKIRRILRNSDRNTSITATLVSENDQNTAWRIKNIQQHSSASSGPRITP